MKYQPEEPISSSNFTCGVPAGAARRWPAPNQINELGPLIQAVARRGVEHALEPGVVIGTIRIPLSPDRRVKVIEVLRSIQGPVLAQPGCESYQIYEDKGPDQAVFLIERWESEAALQEHIRSEAYRRILSAIELAGGPPEVRFDYVSGSEGMELIERLRNLGVSPDETAGPR